MVFEIENKVALVTGGVAGIGLCIVKELLRNDAKGVTIADINVQAWSKVVAELEKEFGPDKVLFVETDVTDPNQFEEAFEQTVLKFQHVDILVNNAGMYQEKSWEKEIALNVNAVVHGILLGTEKYLHQYKQGSEALIVNMASILGTQGYGFLPVYSGTKHAVLGFTKSWGNEDFYKETKVKVIAICPGFTTTETIARLKDLNWGGKYFAYHEKHIVTYKMQEAEWVGTEAMKVIKHATNGSIWVIEGDEPAYEYTPPHRTQTKGITLTNK